MKTDEAFCGSLPQIIRNDAGLYEGDLAHYFRILFNQAQNLEHPYHNFRHMAHVTVMSYFACDHHRDELTGREMRDLLIAALFHDFDHSGMMGNDDLNIARAIRGLDAHLLPDDLPHRDEIVAIIQVTQYPYQVESSELDLLGRIIRDADMSQLFSVAWMQQIIFGLSSEWGKTPLDVLNGQVTFIQNLAFYSGWGQTTFPKSAVDRKIIEIDGLVALLKEKDECVPA